MTHIGTFLLSHALLVQVLHLPPETTILGVVYHDPRTCRITVTHPDIPDNAKLLPVFHTTWREAEKFEQIAETALEDWGIEENDDTP